MPRQSNMLTNLRRLLQPPTFSDTEKNLVAVMLHRLLLTVIGALTIFLVIALVYDLFHQYLGWVITLLIVQILFFFLLRTGRTRLVTNGFIVCATLGLFYSAYQFGGILSASYSGLVVVIIIAGIISKKKITPFFYAGVSILFGVLLVLSEMNNLTHSSTIQLSLIASWIGNSMTVLLSSALLVQAGQISRSSIDKILGEMS